MTASGWVIRKIDDGTYCIVHSTGTFVGGLEMHGDAAFWVQELILRQWMEERRQERRAEMARARLLAKMEPQGRPS